MLIVFGIGKTKFFSDLSDFALGSQTLTTLIALIILILVDSLLVLDPFVCPEEFASSFTIVILHTGEVYTKIIRSKRVFSNCGTAIA